MTPGRVSGAGHHRGPCLAKPLLEAGEGEQQPDSFVERRLRERLKSVQQALEKAREKLAQQARQQELADADLHEARSELQRQTAEIQLLSRRLPPEHAGFGVRNAPGLPPELSSAGF